MRKLAILSLAAGAAFLPAAADAQPAAAGAHAPGAAGHSWGRGGPRPGMPPAMRPPRAAPPHGIPPHVGAGQHGWVFPPHFRGPRFGHIPRLHRGHRMAHFWFAPQFHVRNWQMYGFHQPQPGHRWVRYYDDAYLIDDRGMVMDGRHGLDWDQYGEQWSYDQGIPQYVGSGDYQPDGSDYAWVEQHGATGYAEGPPAMNYGAYDYGAHQQAAYGYHQGGYAYGCGCVTVTTTTTVTTAPTVTTRTYVTEEYVTERVARPQVKRRAVRRAAPVRPAPPRIAPVRGERG